MDEVATGRRIKRSVHDKLPKHAMPGQIERVKREIRERYAAKVEAKSAAGSTSPAAPATAARAGTPLARPPLAINSWCRQGASPYVEEERATQENPPLEADGKCFTSHHVPDGEAPWCGPGTTSDRWRDRALGTRAHLGRLRGSRPVNVAQYGNADPMRCTPGKGTASKSGSPHRASRKDRITIPIELNKRMRAQCELRGLTLADGIKRRWRRTFRPRPRNKRRSPGPGHNRQRPNQMASRWPAVF